MNWPVVKESRISRIKWVKKLKLWWLKRKMRKAMKNTKYIRPAWLDDPMVGYLPPKKVDFNRPKSELPQSCPECGGPMTPSKIDGRVAACMSCNYTFLTKAAWEDPNIQRDITHANAGITPRPSKIYASGEIDQDIKDREIREARAFGQGWTYGRYGISREEYNAMRRRENEIQNDEIQDDEDFA